MKLLFGVFLFVVVTCQVWNMVMASARYEKGLVMGYLLGNYQYFNGRLGSIPIPLILAHISR